MGSRNRLRIAVADRAGFRTAGARDKRRSQDFQLTGPFPPYTRNFFAAHPPLITTENTATHRARNTRQVDARQCLINTSLSPRPPAIEPNRKPQPARKPPRV